MSAERGDPISQRPRLLLADDHAMVAEGLRKLLETDFDLVGMVENGRDLLEAAERLRPDLILLDISMPLVNGIEAARQLRRTLPGTKLIFLSMHGEPGYVSEALRLGAAGYVLKRAGAGELLQAIRHVLAGGRYLSPQVAAGLGEGGVDAVGSGELTVRQREVIRLVVAGCAAKEIAAQLQISTKTVEFHKARILRQLGIRSTAELVRYAVEHGLV
ncbi:MAG TPA: response regulator transcription factor [Bryobacteraceae bacterium]|jgi:DNA-binding NarL/FixJ family response regulator|nr:response regulator transcription factor [Bryobacteraceae bacterium]